ncbi:chaperone protein dnaJ 11, chloroplastic-like [Bidens hawaiensis]|uniref:chaperone protein dnaJ 11, chloroplastic-like n=1 Tax=Bidens hawaiensis TaxID=980011 RepID=UPI0040492DB5
MIQTPFGEPSLNRPRLRSVTRFQASLNVTDAEPQTLKRRLSLYQVLRVKRDATAHEIKAAYRSLAKLYHPDSTSQHDDGKFIEIHNAYATLCDPADRAVYDMKLNMGRSGYYTTVGKMREVYISRRWESDQCW